MANIPFIVGGFVQLTDKDGDPVFLKTDTINGVYLAKAQAGAFFGHEQSERSLPIVVSAAGAFKVTESQEEIMALIAEATEKAAAA